MSDCFAVSFYEKTGSTRCSPCKKFSQFTHRKFFSKHIFQVAPALACSFLTSDLTASPIEGIYAVFIKATGFIACDFGNCYVFSKLPSRTAPEVLEDLLKTPSLPWVNIATNISASNRFQKWEISSFSPIFTQSISIILAATSWSQRNGLE